ncbi:hypothetical protein PPYR_06105 [Photinus pyralis]|uniref:EF-hand domain-containing protein n=1 Tax=Photinus pyralis TaxID=7054 RepID=A0A1Y1K2X8_PHOPY|nr:colorectal mutant cancer protein isoform X1 [Photinus pyralis]KAB0800365.1 hypothetical protein PPYR_06105 [Photinus pyralis]
MESTDCASENASSICEEDRVKRLFQACDTNGDGFIDNQDLLAVCKELCLEEYIDELMLELGADAQGRISYEQFLQRRLALRPEIDALKTTKNADNISDHSQGKLDSWEWDSGARDMSPIPKSLLKKAGKSRLLEEDVKERLQQKLEEQSQRYEEQLTELHSVIAELTRKLHQQRSMAIVEEDEGSEVGTSGHEDSITCPLEVSELDAAENDLSDFENKIIPDSPIELPEPKFISSIPEGGEVSSEIIESLKLEIVSLKAQLLDAQGKLTSDNYCSTEKEMNASSPDSHIESDYNSKNENNIKYSSIVPIHKNNVANLVGFTTTPVTKVAERIKLKRATDSQRDVKLNDLVNTDLPTAIAEHIVGDILRQCDVQSEKYAVDLELRSLTAKLEHTKAQNSVLALTLSETKSHCDRLALLCGKYESNAIALRLALGVMDRAVEAYDVLLALLETELALNQENEETVKNRIEAEIIAKQLLHHLDMFQDTDVLLSPWQNRAFTSPNADSSNMQPWTADEEVRLREHVSRLKAERSTIQGTYVVLESPQVESTTLKLSNTQESRKMDLEMAVLIQELMGLREEKVDLISKLYTLEKDKSAIQLKLKYVEGQQKAQAATLKNLQGQLKDTEALLAIATQNKERGYSDAEHAQGVELELIQALAREARLKIRLQELVSTLEQVTKNAEARLLEGREMVHDLNNTNSILADTVDRNHKKYQARLTKMEQQMISMVERHNSQVATLQQRIAALETPQTNSSENSLNSVPL